MTSPTPRATGNAFLALVRHARAVRSGQGEPDSERALSPEGRAEFELQLARLESVGFCCDSLWSSPWRRAWETAAAMGARFHVDPQEHPGLCSDPGTPAWKDLVLQATAAARIARLVLVGHQPWLAQLARELGATQVSEIECGEVLWLAPRSDGRWLVAARLHPD